MTKVRLLPLVAFAALCLLGLKAAGLVFSGGYVLTGQAPVSAQEAAPAETPAPSKSAETAEKPPVVQLPQNNQSKKPVLGLGDATVLPSSEMAEGTSNDSILESLAKRRRQVEEKAQKLTLRENLLKAAENQVAKRIKELKEIEARISTTNKNKDQDDSEQLGRLVKMYSTMKPKAAARIFNRLDINILKDLVREMKTRKMAPILAAMDPARAELLTIEIARSGKEEKTPELPEISDLPKIPSRSPNS